jgi:uncharacterized protein YabE (DUF348 family)
MKIISHRSTTSFRPIRFIIAGTILFVVLISIVAARVGAASPGSAQTGRLVTINDRGNQIVISTEGATVGDALKQAGIKLDGMDAVEPASTEKLVASEYNVNVYRARPVIVVDGAVRQKVMTPYQSATQIAKSAGITLYSEDTTTITQSNDIVSTGAGLVLTIKRAKPFTFVLYGQQTTVRTQEKTIGDFLKQKGITLGADDSLSTSISRPVTANMTLELWRNGKQTINASEDIAFDVQTVQNADQLVGYKQVQTAGIVGKKTVTYEVEMRNGIEIGRTQIQSLVTAQPSSEVDVIGAKIISGDISAEKSAFMANAGMSQSDYQYADYIISHESGWCATKWQGEFGSCPSYHGTPNSSGIGYGLCQATPGYKMVSAGTDWATNPITQLQWCSNYAVSRYGNWFNAYSHWLGSHNW